MNGRLQLFEIRLSFKSKVKHSVTLKGVIFNILYFTFLVLFIRGRFNNHYVKLPKPTI